jgi:exonuclease V gamma subunit
MYYTRAEKLAHEIAETLEDWEAEPLYLTFAKQVPEEQLRKILRKVLSIPEEKIRRTRGALFTYLVKQYAEREHRSSGY